MEAAGHWFKSNLSGKTLSKYRITIPDFHLSETNTIVEIKSTYFYDPINMKDKFVKYKELGYNFKLILDKIEYLEPILVN